MLKIFKKRIFVIFYVVILLFVFGISTSHAQINLIIASAFEPEHVLAQVANKWSELLDERTEGRISVEVVVGGAYGDEVEIAELVTLGSLEAHTQGAMSVQMYAEPYFMEMPYVFEDFPHLIRVWHPDNPVTGKPMHELLEAQGNQKILSFVYRGVRQFTSNTPVRHPDDVKGLKLRLPAVGTWVPIWEAIGATPTTIPLPELYTALQTGAADASEGDPEQLWGHALYEVQDYIALTNHLVVPGTLVVNTNFYNSLSSEDQEMLRKAAVDACEWGTELAASREFDLINRMEEKGVTVTEVDYDAFYEAALPAILKNFERLDVSPEEVAAARDWEIPENLGWKKLEDAFYRGVEKAKAQ